MDLGKRVKQLRVKNDMTLEELASRTELTKGFLSQLERNLASPSIATLEDIVRVLGVSLADFFKETEETKVTFGEQDYFVDEKEQMAITYLVPNSQSNQMEPVLVTIQPHASLPTDDPHNGEEFGYVLSGRIALYRQETRYDVKAGESFYYEADKPHRIENPGSRPARLIWVTTPPSF